MDPKATITVLAGTNGAGKSSVAGELLLKAGGSFYNPDEATRQFQASDPSLDTREANSLAWHKGRELLQKAIEEGLAFNFETTLGGNTIPRLLEEAALCGASVSVWYVGLADADLHIKRVRARVGKGGHNIPDQKIRERFEGSRHNLVRLLPVLAYLSVFDNSAERDPDLGLTPQPRLILRTRFGVIEEGCALTEVPEWAKPIVMAAIKITGAAARP